MSKRYLFGVRCLKLAIAGRMDLLREAAVSADFAMFDDMRPAKLHDLTDQERMIVAEMCNLSCQSVESITQLCRSVEYLHENKAEGAIVECGVFQGASILAIIRRLQSLGVTDRDIWLYDTFEGMPEPEAVDNFYCEKPGDNFKFWEAKKRVGGGSDWVRAEMNEVQTNIAHCAYPADKLHFIKGLVEDTIPASMPDKIALLRLDTDFYSSTKHEFVHLYPKVVSGGVVIIDDYGAYQGSRQATDEYIKEMGLRVLLSRVDEHVRIFVKP